MKRTQTVEYRFASPSSPVSKRAMTRKMVTPHTSISRMKATLLPRRTSTNHSRRLDATSDTPPRNRYRYGFVLQRGVQGMRGTGSAVQLCFALALISDLRSCNYYEYYSPHRGRVVTDVSML